MLLSFVQETTTKTTRQSDFRINAKENNLTENLEREEMITTISGPSASDSLLHCNVHKCVSGVMFLLNTDTTIEKCNIIHNKPDGDRHELIYNTKSTILTNCVFACNTHTRIFRPGISEEIITCFFCNNAFSHDGGEMYVPTLRLDIMDANSCKRGSYSFSGGKETKSISIFMSYMLIE